MGDTKSVVVITDTNVEQSCRNLLQTGLPTQWLTIPAGEASKTLDTARQLYGSLAELKVDRKTAILGLGGGVVGDLAGFVAATYLRGLPFWQLPTSLLAMVDSSIGGKVGVDFEQGKNLVGAFYAPQGILADLDTLATLPPEEFENGMAEVIKHAVLKNKLGALEKVHRGGQERDFILESAPSQDGRGQWRP